MSIIRGGFDLSKNIFAVHGVDENGKAVLGKPDSAIRVNPIFRCMRKTDDSGAVEQLLIDSR